MSYFCTTTKAEYGARLLEHLSEDLQPKLGSGFSKRNLYKMREFYLAHSILPAPAILNWPIIEFRGEQESVFIRVNLRLFSFCLFTFDFLLSWISDV